MLHRRSVRVLLSLTLAMIMAAMSLRHSHSQHSLRHQRPSRQSVVTALDAAFYRRNLASTSSLEMSSTPDAIVARLDAAFNRSLARSTSFLRSKSSALQKAVLARLDSALAR